MDPETDKKQVRRERWKLLVNVQRLTERPMIALSLVWLALVIQDLSVGLNRPLQLVSDVIWVLFIVDFAVRLTIAPNRITYLRHHWLTALALFLPALRALRAFRALRSLRSLRAARSLNVVRVLTSANRGLSAARRTFGKRGLGYVVVATVILSFLGAAGVLHFEEGQPGSSIDSYSKALWWAAMTMTTLGSEYAVKSGESRVIAFLLALYALGVFGYITAAVAGHFVGQEVRERAERPNNPKIDALTAEISRLRQEIGALRAEKDEGAIPAEPRRAA